MNWKITSLFAAAGLCLGATVLAQTPQPNPPADLSVEGGTSLPPAPSGTLFFDDFEYNASRTLTPSSTFLSQGWTGVKSENTDMARGAGYIYTLTDSIRGSRVLVMESRPSQAAFPPGWSYGQTDYYLKMGREGGPLTAIPANVWFQFWTYSTPESRFAGRDKTLYPCRGFYPCQPGQWSWLFMWGSTGFESVAAPAGGRYLAVQGETADFRGASEYPTNANKLFQNISRTPLLASRWYQVRLHLDVSGAQGVYQAWIRERGQSAWTQIADWRGGVTPNFSWPLPTSQRTGFAQMSTPTTVNGPGDSTVYIDDFAVATSQANLPQ